MTVAAATEVPVESDHGQGRPAVLVVLVAVVVLGQRLALPLGGGGQQIAVTTLAFLAVAAIGLLTGALEVEPGRAVLLGSALTVLAVLTVVAFVRGRSPSVLSLLLLMLVYLPAVAVSRDRRGVVSALRFFVDLMLVLAALGAGLFLLQYAGVPYRDHLADVVPAAFLQQGYNTADPLQFGSSIYRANGVLFLEPSFFALFLALAIAVSLATGHRLRWISLLVVALACTLSGNGVVVLAVCLGALLVLGPRRRRIGALVVPAVAALVLLVTTPVGDLYLARTTEVGAQDTSASLRLVQPYETILPAYVASPVTVLAGEGAGAAQDLVSAQNPTTAVITPAVPKLLFEFGIVGTLCMLAFLLWALLRDGHRLLWAPGLLVAYFVVNAGLLQPTIAATSLLLLSVMGPAAPRSLGAPARVEA